MQTNINLSALDWLSLVSSIFSLILAVVSIWLAIYFYIKAKESEAVASNLLTKLDTQTDLLQKISSKMLDKYVTYSTQPKQADETVVLLAQMVENTLSQGVINNGTTTDNRQIMQELTTLYIAVAYHSALLNIDLQSALPSDMAELEDKSEWLKTIIDRSKADFQFSWNWLQNHGGKYIETSPAKQYHTEMASGSIGDSVKDTTEVYVQRAAASQ